MYSKIFWVAVIVFYLIDGMEVLIIEVSEEPEDPRTKNLSEKHDK